MSKITQLEQIAKRLRILGLQMSTKAGSGHPTTSMSAAEIGACLFFNEMHLNVKDSNDIGNDEIVFSKGHATPLLWPLYAEAGIVSHKELMFFREFTSVLEGHPTPRMKWIKAATGSLGQGLSIALGIAIAQKLLKTPARTYCLLGDGELAEGSIWEAAALASKRKVNNLCAIADINRLGQSGETIHGHDIEAYRRKFTAFGWNAIVIYGHSIPQILKAFEQAKKSTKPTIILAKTRKGKGVSFLEDKEDWHGKALKSEQLVKALKELGKIPEIDAKKLVKPAHKVKKQKFKPIPQIKPDKYSSDTATRVAFGNALAKIGSSDSVVALDGDVKNSTFTEFFFNKYPKRSIECFIAEQNMIGIAVGLASKGFIPFAASFAAFLTRADDFIRMAVYSNSNIKLCGSHVGISIGKDGPSQMGLEDLALFRSKPNCTVLYPCDAISSEKLTYLAAKTKGMFYIRTTRPKTPIIYKQTDSFPIGKIKTVITHTNDKVTIIAAGITLHESIKATKQLEKQNINVQVIDCYSVKPLDVSGIKQAAKKTKDKVIVVEDHYPEGGIGEAVAAQTGLKIEHLAVREIPRSGEPEQLMQAYTIDADAIMKAVKKLL